MSTLDELRPDPATPERLALEEIAFTHLQDMLARANTPMTAERIARSRRTVAMFDIEELRRFEHPVVRDPHGGINLRAFGQDAQNIHRSSVQQTVERALADIVKRPLLDQDTYQEITEAFRVFDDESVLIEMANMTEAFGYRYSDVLDHVWAIIRIHTHKDELVKRLYDEISDGRGMCSNGKMCRLLNVLQGFEELGARTSDAFAFQSKFATLASLPMEEREVSAKAVFDEYDIPEAERGVWLNSLLEA